MELVACAPYTGLSLYESPTMNFIRDFKLITKEAPMKTVIILTGSLMKLIRRRSLGYFFACRFVCLFLFLKFQFSKAKGWWEGSGGVRACT